MFTPPLNTSGAIAHDFNSNCSHLISENVGEKNIYKVYVNENGSLVVDYSGNEVQFDFECGNSEKEQLGDVQVTVNQVAELLQKSLKILIEMKKTFPRF